PPACVNGCNALRTNQAVSLPTQPIPPGKYTLVANLIFESSAQGYVHGFSEAVYTPNAGGISPTPPENPLRTVPKKDFGLPVTLKVPAPCRAAPPSAFGGGAGRRDIAVPSDGPGTAGSGDWSP